VIVFGRFLEVDGEPVMSLSDNELYKLLNSKDRGLMRVVVLRTIDQSHASSVSADDVESLREDLSLALFELESAQAENAQLTAELAWCVALD